LLSLPKATALSRGSEMMRWPDPIIDARLPARNRDVSKASHVVSSMIRMNHKFVPFLKDALEEPRTELPSALIAIAEAGFVEVDGRLMLKGLNPGFTETSARPPTKDEVNFESFENHLHLEDYIPAPTASHAFTYIDAVFTSWRRRRDESIIAILGAYNDGEADGVTRITIRFHLDRSNGKPQLTSESLDNYWDAVFEMSSLDHEFLRIFRK
jgi:hypothetical protein